MTLKQLKAFKEESVEIVNLFVDLQPVANIIILSDTFQSGTKSKRFYRFIIPYVSIIISESFIKDRWRLIKRCG